MVDRLPGTVIRLIELADSDARTLMLIKSDEFLRKNLGTAP